jgi:hypothetical protein
MSEKDSERKCFFSSSPMAVAFNIRWVRYMLLFGSLLFLGAGIWTILCITDMRLQHFSHYRFTALERRDQGVVNAPGIQSFGLLVQERGGHTTHCRARLQNATFVNNQTSMIMSLPADYGYDASMHYKRATGWYFVTSDENQSTHQDPVRTCSHCFRPAHFKTIPHLVC